MQIELDKTQWRPVVVTIESRYEAVLIAEALGESTIADDIKSLSAMGVLEDHAKEYSFQVGRLYNFLENQINESED